MPHITYRKLTLTDIPDFIELRITQLLEEGAEETIDLRPALNHYYTKHIPDGTFVGWLAIYENEIIATSGLSINERPPYFKNPSGSIGVLSSMYTKKNFRRKGIATILLEHIVAEAKNATCDLIQITASDDGMKLYSSFGFVPNNHFMQYQVK